MVVSLSGGEVEIGTSTLVCGGLRDAKIGGGTFGGDSLSGEGGGLVNSVGS